MVESNKTKDFKERFEFRLMLGDNILCGRYFKIMDFNPVSLSSFDLADTVRECAKMIDQDLKMKTLTYLELVAPRIFQDEKEMKKYFSKKKNRETMKWPGEGIVLRDENAPNYVWDAKTQSPVPAPTQFSDGELNRGLTNEDIVTYKLSFLDNGREVVSTTWDGIYPKSIRKKIDLSNRGPKMDEPGGLYTLGFEAYLKAKMTEGKGDLVYKIIKEICQACTHETGWYTTSDTYMQADGTEKVYKNRVYEKKTKNE